MNDLEYYFYNMAVRQIEKWSNYFDIYDAHLSRFRGTKVNVLEIGIGGGGCLQMWKWYFGRKAKIFGIDICKEKLFSERRIKTFVCDQADSSLLLQVIVGLPVIDILIDDGGHTMEQQINTFKSLYHFLSDGGVYICEDIHTSFFPEYGGGPDSGETFMSFIIDHIDQLSADHSRDQVPKTNFSLTTDSIHFYDSMVVIERGKPKTPIKIIARVRNEA